MENQFEPTLQLKSKSVRDEQNVVRYLNNIEVPNKKVGESIFVYAKPKIVDAIENFINLTNLNISCNRINGCKIK